MKNYKIVFTLTILLFLSTLSFFSLRSEADENKLLYKTGPCSLAYAIGTDGCLVWILRTKVDTGYREVLMDLNGRHCLGSDISKKDMNSGSIFLLSADYYKDYNDAVKVGKLIVINSANEMPKIKVFVVRDPYQKNISGESKFISISELSSLPCEYKNFKYSLSTKDELILIHEKENTIKVFQDSNGRHSLNQETRLQDLLKKDYELVQTSRTPSGKIKLCEKIEKVKYHTEQSLKSKAHKKDQVQLPPFKHLLVGPNEVRVKNPNNFDVSVGLRVADNGKDFNVAANGMASVLVPNGAYKIYFIYSNKPDALFQGGDFSLNNNGVEIQIVKVVGGNYAIRRVN